MKEIDDNNLWSTIFGPKEVGVTVQIKIDSLEGIVKQLSLNKVWIKMNTVLYSDIFETDGIKVGYLVFNSFLLASKEELNSVFKYFSQESVEELILDLRV